MGNNDWGSPGPTGPAGNPWRQEEPAPSKAGGLATGIIVAAVAVVVLVVGLVAAGVWMWTSQDDGEESASPAFTAVPDDTTTSVPTSTPSRSPSSSPSPSPSVSPSVPSVPSVPSGTPGASDAPSNLTSQGWRGVSAATCNASDQWVFAGTNGEDHAVVCRVGERGDLYYRGHYNDRAAEYDIDMQRAGSGRWVTRALDNNGSRVEISGSGVRVVDGDGDSVSSRTFTWSSEDGDR